MFPEQTPGCSSRLPPPEFRAAHSDPAAAASVTALGAALPRDHGSLRAGSTLPVTEDVMLPRRARWGPGRRGAVSRRNTQVPGSVILPAECFRPWEYQRMLPYRSCLRARRCPRSAHSDPKKAWCWPAEGFACGISSPCCHPGHPSFMPRGHGAAVPGGIQVPAVLRAAAPCQSGSPDPGRALQFPQAPALRRGLPAPPSGPVPGSAPPKSGQP